MSKQQEAMRLALDALEGGADSWERVGPAIDALRTALAEKALHIDIIRMARVAGCHDNGEEFRFVELHYLERFAALVAAAEREACAKVCDNIADVEYSDYYSNVIRARGWE